LSFPSQLRAAGVRLAALLIFGVASAHEADPTAPIDYEPPGIGTYSLPVIMEAPDGRVVGTDGRAHRLSEFLRGHVTLVSFMYTRCRDPRGCPLAFGTLIDLKRSMARERRGASEVRFVSLSFDPDRDTPEAMRRYGSHVMAGAGPRWTFLTTPSRKDLAPLLDGFGQDLSRGRDEATGLPDGSLSHVLKVFLVDARGQVREIYSTSFLVPGVVRNDIETLLLEMPRHRRIGDASLGMRRGSQGAAPRPAEAALGRKLFFDRRLSPNRTMSCGMCHVPEQGFASNEMATAVGIGGRSLRRNAPTSLNVGDVRALFVDGRSTGLEEQVWGPMLAVDEMGNASRADVVARIESLPGYARLFARAFGSPGVSPERVARAIASYERTLVAADTPFDRWRYGGRPAALDEAAKHGFAVFERSGCSRCHVVGPESAPFTDDAFHDTGVAAAARVRRHEGTVAVELAPGVGARVDASIPASVGEPERDDTGRYEVSGQEADRDAFRTPGLRNVALTAPYMHDGSLRTLEAVIDFYDRGPADGGRHDPRLRPLGLSEADKAALVAFLRSLTSPHAATLARAARAYAPD